MFGADTKRGVPQCGSIAQSVSKRHKQRAVYIKTTEGKKLKTTV